MRKGKGMIKKIFVFILLLLSRAGREYLLSPPAEGISLWTSFWCRFNGHKEIIWYSSGDEPDMRCKNCLDDLR